MGKPPEFEEAYMTAENIAYTRHRPHQGEGGVLARGRTVWIEGTPDATKLRGTIRAYIDEIGVVTLDSRGITKHLSQAKLSAR